jgi:hypothetical protein
MTMTDAAEQLQTIKLAAGFAAEGLIPGGSNALKGDLMSAGIFAALGFAARAALGMPGVLLVSAASISKAVTGRHLHEALGLGGQPVQRSQQEPGSLDKP